MKNLDKMLSITISERFFKMQTLENYINNNIQNMNTDDISNIIFQVVHTLAIIREKYPKFNHNLLSIDKINLYLTEKNTQTTKYTYKNLVYNIKNSGFIIKLTNFHAAEIESNSTDDIKTFFNSLLKNKLIKELIK